MASGSSLHDWGCTISAEVGDGLVPMVYAVDSHNVCYYKIKMLIKGLN